MELKVLNTSPTIQPFTKTAKQDSESIFNR